MKTVVPRIKEKRIGYALGGGAARGLFHIGVLSVLEENGIYPDIITGTSMGSIIGALYASGLSAAELKRIAIELDWKQIIRLTDITLPMNGLIQGRRITALLKSIIKDRDISQLKIKYACVATDLTTGEQVVFDKGPLIDAIRASISIPLIFTPVKIDGRILVDGGMVNVVPVSVCRDMGADFIIGVNCITGPGEKVSIQEACQQVYGLKQRRSGARQVDSVVPTQTGPSKSRIQEINDGIKTFLLYSLPKGSRQKIMDSRVLEKGILPRLSPDVKLADVISQTFTIIMYHIAMENIKDADLAVLPFAGNIGFWQFNRAKDAISAGEIAARLALQRDDIARIMLQQHSLSYS